MENLRPNNGAIPRVAVIGCGNIGSRFDEGKSLPYALSHCGAYQLLKVPIIALADPNKSRLAEAGKQRSVTQLYQSADTLIEQEDIGILSICTPTSIRYPLIKKAVEKGISVIICEKPIANTVEEGQQIVDLITNSRSKLLVNYSRRWDPTIQLVREQIKNGAVGKIQKVSATYGKGLLNNGGHLINLFQYFFGTNYQPMFTQKIKDDLVDKDPTIHCWLNCKSSLGNFPIFLQASDHRAYTVFEMDIIGTKKRIQITDRGIHIKIEEVYQDPLFRGYQTLKTEKISEGTYYETMGNAIQEAINLFNRQQEITVSSAKDALETIQIIDSIYQHSNNYES